VTRVTLNPLQWIILTYRLPNDQSRARTAVWREIRRSGALHLQQSVVAFPDASEFRDDVERLRQLIISYGGSVLTMRADPLVEDENAQLLSAWNAARGDEYEELVGRCENFLNAIEQWLTDDTLTAADLQGAEAEFEKLQTWHSQIKERDVYRVAGRAASDIELSRARDALLRLATAVRKRSTPA
jgi:hypothetical protein